MSCKNIAVIFAGGVGERMRGQDRPKQFVELRGKPIVAYALEHFQSHAEIDAIVLVALEGWLDYCASMAETLGFSKIAAIVPGGETSQESIRLGLEAARERYGEGDIALIHDGVRPLIDARTISRCIQSVHRHGSAITISPQMETVMMRERDGERCHIVERSRCQVARAPQCFYLGDILSVHQRAWREQRLQFVDCASMMEYYGHPLHPVQGPDDNIKITTALDLQAFRAILDEGELRA